MGGSDNKGINSLISIIRGSSIFLIGSLVSRVIQFIFIVILTNYLGAAIFGTYIFIIRLVRIASDFSDLGADQALLKLLPKYSEKRSTQRSIIAISLITTFIVSIFISIIAIHQSDRINHLFLNNDIYLSIFPILIFLLPIITLINVTTSVFRAIEVLEYRVFIRDFLHHLTKLVLVGVVIIAAGTIQEITVATVIAGAFVFLVSFVLLWCRTPLQPRISGVLSNLREYYSYALPLTVSRTGALGLQHLDVLMIGYFLTAADVGVYHVSLGLSALIGLPLIGINQLFPPIASRYYENQNMKELEKMYSTVTRWILTSSALICIVIVVFRVELLSLFGREFTAGTTILLVLALSKFIDAAIGPSGSLLSMTDLQNINALNQFSTIIFNFALNYILIIEYGLIGAAIATAISLTIINILRVLEVWWFLDISPYTKSYFKPILLLIPTSFVMYFSRTLWSGIVLVILGSALGAALFIIGYVMIGLDPYDKQLLKQIKENI